MIFIQVLRGHSLGGGAYTTAVLCSHVTAFEPVDCLRANKRTQLTALRSSLHVGSKKCLSQRRGG